MRTRCTGGQGRSKMGSQRKRNVRLFETEVVRRLKDVHNIFKLIVIVDQVNSVRLSSIVITALPLDLLVIIFILEFS